MIHEPKLIMLDEPCRLSTQLDAGKFLNLIRELKKDATVLFSTHILNDAEEVSEEILLMNDGKLIEQGPISEIRGMQQTVTIRLAFEKEPKFIHEKLKEIDSVYQVTEENGTFDVSVHDLNAARDTIFSRVQEEGWELSLFEITSGTLEDIFMKAVNNNAMDRHSEKELTENWRNFKWLWVPIVFILISIMDLISTYYMPIIIESAGGLPEGTVIDIPMPSPSEAMLMSFSQLNMIGVLILTVMSMGTISGEIKSGVYELILAKPVKYTNYVTGKFFSYWLLMMVSLLLGLLASWYYTNLLFGELALSQMFVAALFYACWLTLVIAIVILYNTWFKSPGLIAFLSIITVIILTVMTNIFGHVLGWSPAKITEYISIYLHTGDLDIEIWFSAIVTLLLSLACILFAIVSLRNRAID